MTGIGPKSLKQLSRYVLVGLASNAAGYMVYLLVTYFGVAPKLAMSILYGFAATIGYVGNRNITFAHKGGLVGTGLRYAMSHFLGYLINLGILVYFVDHLGYAHQLVQAIAIFVVAGFLFVAFKLFVFPDRNASESGTS